MFNDEEERKQIDIISSFTELAYRLISSDCPLRDRHFFFILRLNDNIKKIQTIHSFCKKLKLDLINYYTEKKSTVINSVVVHCAKCNMLELLKRFLKNKNTFKFIHSFDTQYPSIQVDRIDFEFYDKLCYNHRTLAYIELHPFISDDDNILVKNELHKTISSNVECDLKFNKDFSGRNYFYGKFNLNEINIIISWDCVQSIHSKLISITN